VINQENPNMGPMMNVPGTMQPWHMMPGVQQSPFYQNGMPPIMSGVMTYKMMYPDIYYKLQPHILMACDEMDMYGQMMPTQEMVEQMTDRIHDNVCKMHPELAEYANEYEKTIQTIVPEFRPDDFRRDGRDEHDGFRPRFRRRGPFRDLISILLLSELFGRRRRGY
jgi:hypothetical protein